MKNVFTKIRDKKQNHKYVAIVLQNRRNKNKFLEIHRHDCRHTTCRQFLRWQLTDDKEIVNYTGDKNLHRISNDMLEDYLSDYRIYRIYR